MILARSNSNSLIFGSVETAGAIGGVVGGLLMSAWGGFKRRVHGVLAGHMLLGVCAALLGIVTGLPLWIPVMVLMEITVVVVNASNQAIWQAKVAPDAQGRVFSARRLIAWITNPITPVIGGTLADFVLEPAMKTHGGLANLFGPLFGSGPGSGMGLIFFFSGLGVILVGLAGYFVRPVREAESILPDHDQLKKAGQTPA
jgi:hypothetical protein